ncbi:MAG: hypothetical protein V7727_13470 [Sneathiella sp.]
MSTKTDIIDQILNWCTAAKVSPSTFGKRILSDGKFVPRLQSGGKLTTDTYDRVIQFLADNPPEDFTGFTDAKTDRAA